MAHALVVLRLAKENQCKTGLATLSKCKDVEYVIESIGIKKLLDVIVTAEDVSKGKPDPEIYLLASKKLDLNPSECLVIEDSVNGVKSGLSAGMNVIAIATPFTKNSLLASKVIDNKLIVKDPKNIEQVVKERILKINKSHLKVKK